MTLKLTIFLAIIYVLVVVFTRKRFFTHEYEVKVKGRVEQDADTIHIATAVCGQKHRAQYALPLIKSAIVNSESRLDIHLFTTSEPRAELESIYSQFHESVKKRVRFIFYDPWFPKKNETYWKKLFKPCATQRLFYPNLINTTNSVIHFDSDTFIVSKLETIWNKFNEFNDKEIIGGSDDCGIDDRCPFHFKRENKPTYVPCLWTSGLNIGFLLMKLDKMRKFNFIDRIFEVISINIYFRYIFGDQEIFNIIFSHHPSYIKHFDCTHNYLLIYCNYPHECDVSSGLKLIHGNGDAVFNKNNTGTLIYVLGHKIIDINFNRDSKEIIRDLIDTIDKHNTSSGYGCAHIKKHIFQDYRTKI